MFWNIKHPIFAYMEGHLSLGMLPYTMVGKYPYTQTLLFGILYTISLKPINSVHRQVAWSVDGLDAWPEVQQINMFSLT